MLNYIRAEFYKVLHRKYTYIALGIFLLLEALLVAGHVFHNAHSSVVPNTFGNTIVFIVELGNIGFCACLLTGDMVFAGQYKNSTLKNEVSFGLSRVRIYLGKLIAQTLLSLVYMVVMIGFFLAACAVFLPIDPALAPGETLYYMTAADTLIIVGYFLAVALPIWIGAQAVTCACFFLIRSDVGAAIAALCLTMALDTIVELIGIFLGGPVGRTLLKICGYFPGPMLGAAKSSVGDWAFLGQAWAVGLFWLAVSTAVGLYGFSRKEIK